MKKSLLVLDYDVPTSCQLCEFSNNQLQDYYCTRLASGYGLYKDWDPRCNLTEFNLKYQRPDWCPIIDIDEADDLNNIIRPGRKFQEKIDKENEEYLNSLEENIKRKTIII